MNDFKLVCETPEDMFALGERFGTTLTGGDVVLLYGGLGAGKTLFTKGVMSSLGYDPLDVTSPSFALVNLYRTDELDVYHIDLWRLEGAGEIASAVGLAELLEQPDAALIIEWAEKLEGLKIEGSVNVSIDGDGEGPRTVRISGKTALAESLMK